MSSSAQLFKVLGPATSCLTDARNTWLQPSLWVVVQVVVMRAGPLSKFGSGGGVWGPQPWRYCLALALVVRDLCCGQLRVFG